MKSMFLLAALEYVLMKGTEFLESYTQENVDEVEAFVKKLLPGEDFDDLGWGIVVSFMPKVFEVARTLIDKIDGVSSEERLALMMGAVREISRG